MNGAGRIGGDSPNRSHVPTHAQSSAEIEFSRARVPYVTRYAFSRPTVLRTAALQSKWRRSLAAYGAEPNELQPPATSVRSKPFAGMPPSQNESNTISSITA